MLKTRRVEWSEAGWTPHPPQGRPPAERAGPGYPPTRTHVWLRGRNYLARVAEIKIIKPRNQKQSNVEGEIKPEIKRGGRRAGAGRPAKGIPPATCTQCAVLGEEVARLKRELAGRFDGRPRLGVAALAPATAGLRTDAIRFREGKETVAADSVRYAAFGYPCVHGGVYGVCSKIGCEPE